MPYATEYRENRVMLDTNTLADNVDPDDAVVSVVLTAQRRHRSRRFQRTSAMKLLTTLTRNGRGRFRLTPW